MSAVDQVADEKKGWSTQCRAGNFDTCASLGYRCSNPRHDSDETPDQRAERLRAEARARVRGPEPAPAPAPTVEAAPTHAVTHDGRLAVLQALVDNDGVIAHAGGRATSILHEAAASENSSANFRKLVERMADNGLIMRDVTSTNTWSIEITDAGRAFLNGDPGPARPPATPKQTAPERATNASPKPEPVDPRDPKIEIVWETPAARTNGRRHISEIFEAEGVLDALRSKPGEWARLVTYGSGGGAHGAAKKLRKTDGLIEFEWLPKAQPQIDGATTSGSWLYGRFIG